MFSRRSASATATAFLVAVLVLATPTLSSAVPNPALHYPTITKSGTTATATFAQPRPTQPSTPLTAAISSSKTITLGSSSTLPDTVGFGSVFGSSKGFSYFSITTAKGNPVGSAPTTMTIEFPEPLPARSFGIALADLDGEVATIEMSRPAADPNDPDVPLTGEKMGVQQTYNSATGQPATLRVVETPTTVVIDDEVCAVGFTSSTCNTSNVVAWLWPEEPVQKVVITTTSQTPLASAFYQLWLAYTASQVVSWRPDTTPITLDGTTTITPTAASVVLPPAPAAVGAITYTVGSSSTSDCTVDQTTGALTATTAGTCVVTASAAATDDWLGASATSTFTFTDPPPPPAPQPEPEPEPEPEPTPAPAPKPEPAKPATPTEWSPEVTTFTVPSLPAVIELPPPPPPPGGGAYTFTADNTSTSLCTVDRDTPTITVPQPGTCSVTASVGATKNFSKASVTVSFTITSGPTLAATGPSEHFGLFLILASGATIAGASLVLALRKNSPVR